MIAPIRRLLLDRRLTIISDEDQTMRHLLCVLAFFLLALPAHACRTSGPPGPDDCASAYQQSLERLHQEDLRVLQRQREREQAQRDLDNWRRQVPPLELPARPQDLPALIIPTR